MTILWLTLGLVYLFGFYARYFARPINTGGLEMVKPNALYATLSAATLIIISGLRSNIGDTVYYMHSYSSNIFTWENIKNQKDIGFNIFQMFLQKISPDPQFMIFIVAFITNLLLVLVFYKYSKMFEMSLFIFITSGLFVTSMNGLRQFLAAAIVFTGTKFIVNGNWRAYFIIVLVAAQVHNTAYILIPLYFIVRRKAWSGITYLLLGLAVLIVFGFNQFTSLLFSALENTQYADYKDVDYQGANALRVLVYALPIVLAYVGREKLRKLCFYSDYIVNMSLLALVFMMVSTQNWIFARFTFYFGLYSVLLVSWLIPLFTKRDQRFIYFGVIICYFIYFYYEAVISLSLIYKSNYLV